MPSTALSVEVCVVRVAPLLPQLDKLRCEGVEVGDERITLRVSSCATTGRCPTCDCESRRVHGWYVRTLTDLPWQGRPVTIRWRSRKFRCGNPTCSQQIFTERLPDVAASGRDERSVLTRRSAPWPSRAAASRAPGLHVAWACRSAATGC